MNPAITEFAQPLPRAMPADADTRLFILAVRRMGVHGIDDAQIASHFMSAFGPAFRRPLITIRVMMTEIAAAASTPITIAPCCCSRITGAEAALVDIIARLDHQPLAARALAADLLGNRRVDAVMATLAMVANAFADAGRPIGLRRHASGFGQGFIL